MCNTYRMFYDQIKNINLQNDLLLLLANTYFENEMFPLSVINVDKLLLSVNNFIHSAFFSSFKFITLHKLYYVLEY